MLGVTHLGGKKHVIVRFGWGVECEICVGGVRWNVGCGGLIVRLKYQEFTAKSEEDLVYVFDNLFDLLEIGKQYCGSLFHSYAIGSG